MAYGRPAGDRAKLPHGGESVVLLSVLPFFLLHTARGMNVRRENMMHDGISVAAVPVNAQRVFSCGWNLNGQLGISDTTSRLIPTGTWPLLLPPPPPPPPPSLLLLRLPSPTPSS